MLAEPADQMRLLDLADLDSELGRLQHTAKSLPQHQRIADLMAIRQQVTDDLTALTTQVGDLRIAVKRAEGDLVPVRARLERESKRVADGSVSDPKILRGLLEEIERLKNRISVLEDEELEVMGELESAESLASKGADRKAQVESELRVLVAERNDQVARLQAEAKYVQVARAAKAAATPADLLTLYERIRAQRGLGAARLARGRCSGCQLEITPADLDGYRRAPANQVLRCAECDRILVRTPESGL